MNEEKEDQFLDQNIKSEVVNVDTEESRIKRAKNQYEFEEEKLDDLKGLTFRKRFFAIRKGIFKDFNNVEGENLSESEERGLIVSPLREQNEVHDQAVPYKEAAEMSMEKFEEKIDVWYQTIAEMPEGPERDLVAERLVSVLYHGGILIHPAVDGNGQTFKIMVESYLQELHSKCVDKYIPIKYEKIQDEGKEIGAISIGGGWTPESRDITNYPVKHFEPADEEEKTILDGLELVKNLSHREPDPGSSNEVFNAVRSNAAKRALSIVSSVARETNNRLFVDEVLNKRQNSDPGFILHDMRRVADKIIRQKGLHERWEYHPTIWGGQGQKYERASAATVRLWTTEDGLDLFEKFIFDGAVIAEPGENVDTELFYKVTQDLRNVQRNIMKVLETEEEHTLRHHNKLAS